MFAVEHLLIRAALGEGTRISITPSETCRELQRTKMRVGSVRNALGNRVWVTMTTAPTATLPAKGVHPASRAYHKLKEMALSCALPSPNTSLHLCEAPGGFVQATAEIASPGWEWTALSVAGGPVFATDVLPPGGTVCVCDVVDATVAPASMCLVTADGSKEYDHAHLEEAHFALLEAQTRVAFQALRPGGTFIIKFFEAAHSDTQHWLGWTASAFEHASIIKPTSSRPTNSERYFIGRSFVDTPSVPLERTRLSAAWLADLRHVLDEFDRAQTTALCHLLERAESITDARNRVETKL